jgi:hypothetical protein
MMARLSLPNVTLLLVEGRKYSLAKRAFDHCVNLVDFGDAKILTPELPSVLDHSYFMFTEAYKHVDTEFFLAAQWDGVVWDVAQWDNEYLNYDYIGAPWPDTYLGPDTTGMNVGNGGFSLRSRRLYEYIAHDPMFNHRSYEDVEVCRNQRVRLESAGFTFAPIELAHKFSQEADATEFGCQVPATSFGLHSGTMMQKVLPDFYYKQLRDLKHDT